MVPSERAIEEAVESLSAAAFQQLAECYAAIELPDRFGKQLILGRNSTGSTIAGWPDSYVTMTDGRIDALEATADKASWGSHLDSDLENAAALPEPGLGGFCFITTGSTPRPETLAARRERLSNLGVSGRSQTFVFRQTLITDLCSGRFAQVWVSILGLTVSPHPFSELRAAPIYGTGASGQFMPTEEEYENRLVTRPGLIKRVEERLNKAGFAYVLGRGASGKTALGACLGWQRLKEDKPVYYLDLAEPQAGATDFVRAAAECVVSRGDHDVLFIVDNVHQNEDAAQELYLDWRSAGTGAELLFLGRRSESRRAMRGVKSPLADLAGVALELRVTQAMLRGVFERLRRRQGKDAPDLPNAVQKRWLKLFGGDLIAFGAALAQANLEPPDWSLAPADAHAYLHDRYLHDLAPKEQRDLCIVADRSALELATPETLVSPANVSSALASGIIERRDGEIRTVHPGIGELIVSAAGAQIGDFASEIDAGEREPGVGSAVMVRRLVRRGQTEAAAMLLRRLHATGVPAFEILTAMGAGSLGERLAVMQVALGRDRVAQMLGSREEADRFVATGPFLELLAFRRVLRSMPEFVYQSFYSALASRFESGAIDLKRLAVEAARRPEGLPLRIRQLKSLSPELYNKVVPILAENGAFTACVRAAPGFPKRRWSDLLEAATQFEAVAQSVAAGFEDDPDHAATLLLHKGNGLEHIDAAGAVPVVQEAMISQVQSSAYHRQVQAELLTFGTRKFACAIGLTAKFDPEFLADLDALAAETDQVAARIRTWRSGSKARRRMLTVTRDNCPRLYEGLRAHMDEAGANI